MRRIGLVSFLVVVVLLALMTACAAADPAHVTVMYDDQPLPESLGARQHAGNVFVAADEFARLTGTAYRWDGTTLTFNGVPVIYSGAAPVYEEKGHPYAPLRVLAGILAAEFRWNPGAATATVDTTGSSDRPGDTMVVVNYNGRMFTVPFEGAHRHLDRVYVPVEAFSVVTDTPYTWDGTTLTFGGVPLDTREIGGVHEFEGRLYAPVRLLAQALGARVTWDGANQAANLIKLPQNATLVALDGWNERWEVPYGSGAITFCLVKGRLSFIEVPVDEAGLSQGFELPRGLGLPAPTRLAMTAQIGTRSSRQWLVRLSFD